MRRVLMALALASAILVLGAAQMNAQGPSDPQVGAVLKAEEAFRVAKLGNDLEALGRILADNFYGTNQNGHTRDKAQYIELLRLFRTDSIELYDVQVRITGDTAIVTGAQRENARLDLRFVRVYVKGPSDWQLLSYAQILPYQRPGSTGFLRDR